MESIRVLHSLLCLVINVYPTKNAFFIEMNVKTFSMEPWRQFQKPRDNLQGRKAARNLPSELDQYQRIPRDPMNPLDALTPVIPPTFSALVQKILVFKWSLGTSGYRGDIATEPTDYLAVRHAGFFG